MQGVKQLQSVMSDTRYRRAVADVMVALAESCDSGLGELDIARVRHRARKIYGCGFKIRVRECVECGHRRVGSGEFSGQMTCKSKSCPTCGENRSHRFGMWMEGAAPLVEQLAPKQSTRPYVWQYLVVTTIRGATNASDWRGLRGRAIELNRSVIRAWKKVLKSPGTGMLKSVEISKTGMVHANLIYFGPTVDMDEVVRVMKEKSPRIGHVSYRSTVCEATPKKTHEALGRIARYSTKSASGARHAYTDEDWLSGEESTDVVDPSLVASWEMATYGMNLASKSGTFVGLPLDERGGYTGEETDLHIEPDTRTERLDEAHAPSDPEDDSLVVCDGCGEHGLWTWVEVDTEGWLRHCHDRMQPGIARSRWHPMLRRWRKQRRWKKINACA